MHRIDKLYLYDNDQLYKNDGFIERRNPNHFLERAVDFFYGSGIIIKYWYRCSYIPYTYLITPNDIIKEILNCVKIIYF
jgi:hypothetical protein